MSGVTPFSHGCNSFEMGKYYAYWQRFVKGREQCKQIDNLRVFVRTRVGECAYGHAHVCVSACIEARPGNVLLAGIIGRIRKLIKSLMHFTRILKQGFMKVRRIFEEVRKYPNLFAIYL